MIAFIHIPKAAGSSVKQIFQHQYSADDIFFVEGSNPHKSLSKYIETDNYKQIIFGHFDFGFLEKKNSSVKYISIIRNPIDRVISHYYYVKSHPTHYLYQAIQNNQMSLKDYVESGLTNEINNGQVRMFAGAGGFHKKFFSQINIPYGKCNKELLDIAIENINNHFIFIGIQEEFIKSLILIKETLNWKKGLNIQVVNKTKEKPKRENIDKNTLSIIEKYNKLDLTLYENSKNKLLEALHKRKLYIKKELLIIKLTNLKNQALYFMQSKQK